MRVGVVTLTARYWMGLILILSEAGGPPSFASVEPEAEGVCFWGVVWSGMAVASFDNWMESELRASVEVGWVGVEPEPQIAVSCRTIADVSSTEKHITDQIR
jgi:hypothetical protein